LAVSLHIATGKLIDAECIYFVICVVYMFMKHYSHLLVSSIDTKKYHAVLRPCIHLSCHLS